MYKLEGYDKDGSVYEVIEMSDDLEYLKLKMKDIAEIQKDTDGFRRNNGTGEPFDWFEIWNEEETIRYAVSCDADKLVENGI